MRGLFAIGLLVIAGAGTVEAAPISKEMMDVAIIESAMMLPLNTTQTNNVTYFYRTSHPSSLPRPLANLSQ